MAKVEETSQSSASTCSQNGQGSLAVLERKRESGGLMISGRPKAYAANSTTSPSKHICRKRHCRIRKEERDRAIFIALLSSTNGHVRSPAMERARFQASLYDLYISKDQSNFPGMECFFAYSKSHWTMSVALDTLSLLAIGTANQQRHLLHEARKSYSKTIGLLAGDLGTRPIRNPFILLQTIHVIQLCEMFRCISNGDWAWRRHMPGLGAIIKGSSKEDRILCGMQGRDLIEQDNRISFPLWDGLVSHRHMGTAQELFHTAGIPDDVQMSSRIPIDREVPGVLKYCEYVVSLGKKASLSIVSDAIAALTTTEGKLHTAMANWYADTLAMPYRTVPTNKMPLDWSIVPASTQNIFPHVLTFTTFASALKHAHYWMCLLALYEMRFDIRRAVRGSDYLPNLYEKPERLMTLAGDCADSLCMSLIFMSLPKNGLIGRICAIPPLQQASKWYKCQGDTKKVAWCQQTARALRSQGWAVPSEIMMPG